MQIEKSKHPETVFDEQFQYLNESLEHLDLSVKELHAKIDPILRPQAPSFDGPDEAKGDFVTSRFIDRMSDARHKIWFIKSHVDDLRNWAEV